MLVEHWLFQFLFFIELPQLVQLRTLQRLRLDCRLGELDPDLHHDLGYLLDALVVPFHVELVQHELLEALFEVDLVNTTALVLQVIHHQVDELADDLESPLRVVMVVLLQEVAACLLQKGQVLLAHAFRFELLVALRESHLDSQVKRTVIAE